MPATAPGVLAASAVRCVGALGRGELGFGLQPVRFGGLHLGFGFGDLRLHFRGGQLDEQLAFLDHAAAVHQHAFDVARHLGVQRDGQEGRDLGGQLDGA